MSSAARKIANGQFGRKASGGNGPLIGGIAIGSAGAPGTIYQGFTLSAGDDFNSLSIVSPGNSRGNWFPVRTYAAPNGGYRGPIGGSLGYMYDTDPLMTGDADSNRGTPYGFNNMRQAGSVVALQARAGTAPEIAKTNAGSNRLNLGSTLSGAGFCNHLTGAAGSGDIIMEAYMKLSLAATNPGGTHMTFWQSFFSPGSTSNGDEWDWETSSQAAYFDTTVWSLGTGAPTTSAAAPYANDNNWHLVTFILNQTNGRLYIDGTLYATISQSANQKGSPNYPIFSSHIFNTTWNGDAFSQSAWNTSGTTLTSGATMSVDYIRVWRRTGNPHYAPKIVQPDINIPYGGTTTLTLPSQAALWGGPVTNEGVYTVPTEVNEPNNTYTTSANPLPPGVSWNSSTRTITITPPTGKAGRINFVVTAAYTPGCTCTPFRFSVNVGPNLSALAAITGETDQNLSVDIYALCDCGVLVSNDLVKTKTISVAGLTGSNLSYSDTTGLLTGNPAPGLNTTYQVTCTNSVGQVATSTSLALSVLLFPITDTFSGGATGSLLSHVSDSGSTWRANSLSSNNCSLNGATPNDQVYNPVASVSLQYCGATNATANYYVEGDIIVLGTVPSSNSTGITGRMSATTADFYGLRYNASGALTLFKSVGGTITTLGSVYTTTFTVGTVYTIRLTMNGNQISGSLNGTVVISAVPDTAITAVGHAGLRVSATGGAATNTQGIMVQGFRAVSL